jgi:hypothetical protein
MKPPLKRLLSAASGGNIYIDSLVALRVAIPEVPPSDHGNH